MPEYTAEQLILATIIETKRRQKSAKKEKTTKDKPIVPESLQRAFNDL